MPGAPEQGTENQSGEENQHKRVEFGFSYIMWTNFYFCPKSIKKTKTSPSCQSKGIKELNKRNSFCKVRTMDHRGRGETQGEVL